MEEDLDRLEVLANKNLVKFNKYQVLHLGKQNPGVQFRLGSTHLGNSFVQRDLAVLVDSKLQGVSNVLLKHRKPGGCWAASTSTSPLEIRSHYLTLLSFQAKPKILCLVLVPTMKNNVLKLERVRRSDTKKGNFSIRGKAERI